MQTRDDLGEETPDDDLALADGWLAVDSVVLIDADPLARRAIASALTLVSDISAVLEAPDWRTGAEIAAREQPAAVVLELQPRQANPVEPLARLLEAVPQAAVLVFSVLDQQEVNIAAMRVGARGFVSKQAGLEALVPALRAVIRGEMAISRTLTMQIIRMLREAPEGGRGMRPVRSRLTNREWEVLDLVRTGHSTRDIAERLVLTEDTVYSHVKNIMRKLGAHTRAEAVALIARELRGDAGERAI